MHIGDLIFMIPFEMAKTLVTDSCGCNIGKVLEFAAANNLIITEVGEFNKFTIAIFMMGAIIGIIAWELFKYTYRYGKQHSPKKP